MANRRALFSLFLVVVTELIGFGLIIPVLPQIASRYHVSGLALGLLFSTYSIAQFFAAPLLGRWSDRWGRRPLLVISKLGTVLAYVILAYSQSFTWFLIARLLDGFTGGNIAVARAYVVDVTTKENRSKGMAVIGIAFGLGFVLGPALGGLLYPIEHTHRLPALVAGSLSLLACLLTLVLLPEPRNRRPSRHPASALVAWGWLLKQKRLGLLCATQLIYMSIFSGFEVTFSLFSAQRFGFHEAANSWLFMYLGILGFVIQGILSRYQIKNPSSAVVLGLGCLSVGLGGAAFVSTLPLLVIALALFSVGVCLMMTCLPTLVSYESKEDSTGEMMGLYEAMGSLSRIIGPLLAYGIVQVMYASLYHVYAALLLTLMVIFSLFFKRLSST